jgi:hypothetical protein
MQQTLVDRVLGPLTEQLGMESAQKIVSFDIPPDVQERVRALGARSSSGTLTEQERAEYEGYVTVGNVLGLLKSRARLLLKQEA